MCTNKNNPKTTGAMMPLIKSYVVGQMRSVPFSLVNDGTNDTDWKEMNAACTLIFYVKRSKTVEFKFFDVVYIW